MGWTDFGFTEKKNKLIKVFENDWIRKILILIRNALIDILQFENAYFGLYYESGVYYHKLTINTVQDSDLDLEEESEVRKFTKK